ncbi:MAG TPA: glutamine-hydrolyzing carbamoyl-phosphate synthase small subunit [Chthonomonadales bacterium]|nr:glutamine-hydrolyzing carbamoyl-phosphate synthase small subunit [Chthonomonadales bacterium]
MKAILALQNGAIFEGESLGIAGRTEGEVVFNTGMTGYQEVLTDPSYAGQIVALTYPIVGSYGVNTEDFESLRVQVEGFVVREAVDAPSTWRATQTLDRFLKDRGVVGIRNIDTRELTRSLRVHGVMMGAISTEESGPALVDRLKSVPGYSTADLVRKVTTREPYLWRAWEQKASPEGRPDLPKPRYRLALLDCGVKHNIMRSLARLGCEVKVFPADTECAEVLRDKPDAVVLSPGPGDPARLEYIARTVSGLVGKTPIMGVCLGNQILGTVFGSSCYKLKFGHRGSNHPVKDLATGKVYITSQNHGYAVDADKLSDGMEVSQINLNDGTVEGLKHRELPIFSIQYHPEASPGPTDSSFFFHRLLEMIGEPSH